MPLLFSYGTLRNPDIQKSLYGRILIGTPDLIKGFKLQKLTLGNNTYPALVHDRSNNLITGFVYEISKNELCITDEYEGKAYHRIQVNTLKKSKIWVYIV